MCFITLLLILLGLHQITSLMTVLSQADIIMQAVQPAPALQVALSAAWILVSGLALLRIWRRSPWASAQAVGILIGFAVYSLLRTLIWAQADYDRGRGLLWGFMLGVIGIASVVLYKNTRGNLGTRDKW